MFGKIIAFAALAVLTTDAACLSALRISDCSSCGVVEPDVATCSGVLPEASSYSACSPTIPSCGLVVPDVATCSGVLLEASDCLPTIPSCETILPGVATCSGVLPEASPYSDCLPTIPSCGTIVPDEASFPAFLSLVPPSYYPTNPSSSALSDTFQAYDGYYDGLYDTSVMFPSSLSGPYYTGYF